MRTPDRKKRPDLISVVDSASQLPYNVSIPNLHPEDVSSMTGYKRNKRFGYVSTTGESLQQSMSRGHASLVDYNSERRRQHNLAYPREEIDKHLTALRSVTQAQLHKI